MAYVTLNNRLTMNNASETLITKTNKAVLIWRKQPDDLWKETLAIFNEDPSAGE